MIELGLKFTLAYLLGSILGSLLVGKIRGGVDIRQLGSRNAGGTNALRTQGKIFAFWVMFIDVGKGIVSASLLPYFSLPGVGLDPQVSRELIVVAVGLGVIVGHIYPVWHEFRGGKGGATAGGVICVLASEIAIPVVLFWLSLIVITRYVGLSTMSAAIGASIYIGITKLPAEPEFFVFSLLVAVLIIYTHRDNVVRMFRGTESQVKIFPLGK
ncbi:MAG: acyl-phosphate glycerol 3-phosphate acyltransferase [Rhodospirillaceae bacterium]|nr:acyl-phosphate glycerol 3-phosphate acyltransferase [Rhodospirillaceae bacterium]|tara:strand:+ start:8514 stop:9152 length:639 start_codon:yes stop_codon:yes gene_type:complete